MSKAVLPYTSTLHASSTLKDKIRGPLGSAIYPFVNSTEKRKKKKDDTLQYRLTQRAEIQLKTFPYLKITLSLYGITLE